MSNENNYEKQFNNKQMNRLDESRSTYPISQATDFQPHLLTIKSKITSIKGYFDLQSSIKCRLI